MRTPLTRRALALGAVAVSAAGLAGCAGIRDLPLVGTLLGSSRRDGGARVVTPDYARVYGGISGEPVPPFDYTGMDPGFLRADVGYLGPEQPGTVVVDPHRRVLFLVGEGGRATRYGITVGADLRGWWGNGRVGQRRMWPDAGSAETTASVGSARRTSRPRGVLGARSIALAAAGTDTGLRIHGTPEPSAIGTEEVTGTGIGMIDQDIIHLYGRVSERTPIVVLN